MVDLSSDGEELAYLDALKMDLQRDVLEAVRESIGIARTTGMIMTPREIAEKVERRLPADFPDGTAFIPRLDLITLMVVQVHFMILEGVPLDEDSETDSA